MSKWIYCLHITFGLGGQGFRLIALEVAVKVLWDRTRPTGPSFWFFYFYVIQMYKVSYVIKYELHKRCSNSSSSFSSTKNACFSARFLEFLYVFVRFVCVFLYFYVCLLCVSWRFFVRCLNLYLIFLYVFHTVFVCILCAFCMLFDRLFDLVFWLFFVCLSAGCFPDCFPSIFLMFSQCFPAALLHSVFRFSDRFPADIRLFYGCFWLICGWIFSGSSPPVVRRLSRCIFSRCFLAIFLLFYSSLSTVFQRSSGFFPAVFQLFQSVSRLFRGSFKAVLRRCYLAIFLLFSGCFSFDCLNVFFLFFLRFCCVFEYFLRFFFSFWVRFVYVFRLFVHAFGMFLVLFLHAFVCFLFIVCFFLDDFWMFVEFVFCTFSFILEL